VAVAGPVCTMHCVSIICPVPFPSRLITTHTRQPLPPLLIILRRDTVVVAVGRATDRRNRGDDGLVQQCIMERLGGGQRQAVERAVFNLFRSTSVIVNC